MKNIFILIVTVLFAISTRAQSIQNFVIGSAGYEANTAGNSMSWTIGEVVTDTYTGSNNAFTQGFHQPQTLIIDATKNNVTASITIYPNPVTDYVTLDFKSNTEGFLIELFDAQGRLVCKNYKQKNISLCKVSMEEYANGIYLINITSSESGIKKSLKIVKSK